LKLLRTIRLDPSDSFVFDHAAEPGEWAVTGTFLFWNRNVEALQGKARAAFRSGFVGVESLGFSTLVVVQEATALEHAAAVEALARHILAVGAPDIETARAAASEELAFAASLASHDPNTLVALHRLFEAGEIREQFRTIVARDRVPGADGLHALSRVFEVREVDEPEIEEQVDLVELMGKAP
jgi:hypothetical protein